MVIIIPLCRRGTREGVPVATWCCESICRMRGGLAPHKIIIPAALSLPPLWGAAVGCTPTILQNKWFYLHQNLYFLLNLIFFRLLEPLKMSSPTRYQCCIFEFWRPKQKVSESAFDEETDLKAGLTKPYVHTLKIAHLLISSLEWDSFLIDSEVPCESLSTSQTSKLVRKIEFQNQFIDRQIFGPQHSEKLFASLLSDRPYLGPFWFCQHITRVDFPHSDLL